MQMTVPHLSEAPFQPTHPRSLFIANRWVQPASAEQLEIVCPMTEEVVGEVPAAVVADVDRAVAAARAAFDSGPWPKTSVAARAGKLREIARLLKTRADALAWLWTLEAGAPNMFTSRVSDNCGMIFEHYADVLEKACLVDARQRAAGGYALVTQEPIGVVAAIVPWNAPVFLAVIKVAAALAAGCTVVLKPAPETPLDAYILAECIEAADLPEGTFSIVASGREASDHLVRHPGVDKVTFTGSTATGKHIMSVCADRVARVTLELGGKSAAIVLDDIAPTDCLPGILGQVMGNCGQACVTLSRILVQRDRVAEFEGVLEHAFSQVRLGDPFDPATQIGTLAMERQFDKVNDYVRIGSDEGAKLVVGGARPAGFDRGYFFAPTLFSGVDNAMRIAREEIFGPVLVMIPYDTVDEAVAIANDSPYGLHGALFTHDAERAYALARQLRTGSVGLNGNTMDLTMPFGGWKQSGIGREGGLEGLAGFFEEKTIYLPSVPAAMVA